MTGRDTASWEDLPSGAEPHPDHPGWLHLPGISPGTFSAAIGLFLFRPDGNGRGVCRMFPTQAMLNPGGSVHGGAVLTFIDMSLMAGGVCAGMERGHYVTLDLHNHFVGRARAGEPLDAHVTLVKQSRSFAFLQGTCVQGGEARSNWTGTMKRVRPPR